MLLHFLRLPRLHEQLRKRCTCNYRQGNRESYSECDWKGSCDKIVFSPGHGEDYQVQLAVGQCPRSCIHYVTPSQRIILEELLDRYD